MLELKQRWAVDTDNFEKLFVFAAAAAAAAATAAAATAAAAAPQQQQSATHHLERAELLATDYAFSLLCRYARERSQVEVAKLQTFLRQQVAKDTVTVKQKKRTVTHDFWPALRVLLLFECSTSRCPGDSTGIRRSLSQLPTVLTEDAIEAIATDLQQLLQLHPRVAQYPSTLTDKAVDALFQGRPVMQVIRVPKSSAQGDSVWGVTVPVYLVRVRDEFAAATADELCLDGVTSTPVLCPSVQFQIVRDLSNEDVSKTMRPRFFFELQQARNSAEYTQHSCQHVTPTYGACPCQSDKYCKSRGIDKETFRFHTFAPKNGLKRAIAKNTAMPNDPATRKCAVCGHVHIRVDSFADLVPARAENENSDVAKPILLVLVDKGRLGDTFPSTFECMDMRARPNIKLLDSAVQELGRLCRYSSGSTTPPYALVAPILGDHLAAAGGSLEQLIANKCNQNDVDEHISRIGGAQPIEASESQSLVAHLRRNFHAYSSTKAKAGDARMGSYDIDRSQSQPSTSFSEAQKPRWHKRRFVLFGEPQIGKTAALVHCIATLRARARQAVVDVLLADDDNNDSDDGCFGAGVYQR